MSTSKFQVSLRCPVLPTLSIAYTLRKYISSGNIHAIYTHVTLMVPDVKNVSKSLPVLTCTTYPLTHHVSVASYQSNPIMPVFHKLPDVGKYNSTLLGDNVSCTIPVLVSLHVLNPS